MTYEAVIDMNNPNALIAMAQVSQNANNPFYSFCEYIKYCIYCNASDVMTIAEIREAVGQEFGIFLPRNIELKCIAILQNEKSIRCSDSLITRIGEFDTVGFDSERIQYRETETKLIRSLISYVSKYGKSWDESYAREQLIGVLDRTGLAYDIFFQTPVDSGLSAEADSSLDHFDEALPDDEEIELDDDCQPIFTDSFYVGKFVKELLAIDSIEKTYLNRICEGLMLCTGAFQIPSSTAESFDNQRIKGTTFFFDTKLLLRFIGCAGEAAIQSAKELVQMIQNHGGTICYYPQTLEEMNSAFDNAIRRLSNGYPPRDNEMRLYSNSVNRSIPVIATKKAGLVAELSRHKIYKRDLGIYSDAERLRFGFSRDDLRGYMQKNLRWEQRAIENDASSIWETHMLRQGNYNDYCGTNERLPVFVTTNTKLIRIVLKYRKDRPTVPSINGWKCNRLPVITDMRLTCRLWSPAQEGDRLSLLYLTANAVAAQRPTPRYINKIREMALMLRKQVPEYSEINLTEFFDDNVTDSLLQSTHGEEKNLNIGTFASTLNEISEIRAAEEEKRTAKAKTERDQIREKYDAQQQGIIDSAVNASKDNLGMLAVVIKLLIWWPAIITILFAGIAALLSWAIGNWNIVWIASLPLIVKIIELIFASAFVERHILRWFQPKIESAFEKRIGKNLRVAELPFKETIVQRTKEETKLWCKFSAMANNHR